MMCEDDFFRVSEITNTTDLRRHQHNKTNISRDIGNRFLNLGFIGVMCITRASIASTPTLEAFLRTFPKWSNPSFYPETV